MTKLDSFINFENKDTRTTELHIVNFLGKNVKNRKLIMKYNCVYENNLDYCLHFR